MATGTRSVCERCKRPDNGTVLMCYYSDAQIDLCNDCANELKQMGESGDEIRAHLGDQRKARRSSEDSSMVVVAIVAIVIFLAVVGKFSS